MSKSPHPRALDLRIWAGKLERNLLDPEESRYIATLLRRVAGGESFDEVLGVKRVAHRPSRNTIQHYVEQVYGLSQPLYDGKPGMSVEAAIKEVAQRVKVDFETVKQAYYSKAGRTHLRSIKEALKNPLA
jgi:hypothetical protein